MFSSEATKAPIKPSRLLAGNAEFHLSGNPISKPGERKFPFIYGSSRPSVSPSLCRHPFGCRLCELLHWPGARDEDVDQPPSAFLPVRAGGYIGDADQNMKQIAGIEVVPYVAALDPTFHQIAKCLLHQSMGIFEHFVIVAEQRIQRRRDDLFCRDGVNEQ